MNQAASAAFEWLEIMGSSAMKQKRQKSVLGLGWACFEAAAFGRTEHAQTVEIYPESVVRRIKFQAGGGYDWRIHALETPRDKPAPWKIIVITGAPSWAEYWADTMAALPQDRQMVVVDRPGFAASEPHLCIPDIRVQARALESVLVAAPGQKILLVGQSYGAAVSRGSRARACTRMSGTQMLGSLAAKPGRSTTTICRSCGRAARVSAQYSAHDGAPVITTIFQGAGLSRGVSRAWMRQS